MKIYHCVESYYPAVGGMQEVVKQLSERLVKLGHEVTVLTRKHDKREFKELNGVKIIEFAIDGNPIIPVKPEDHRYISFLLELKGDVITFFAAQQWATNLALPILQKIALKKVSVPTGYSGLYWPTFKKYYEDMKQFIHHYDMNVYLSDDYRDINYARDNGVKNLTLIPNGAAEDEFLAEDKINIRKELGLKESDFILLLVGSYTGWKGHKEAIEMFLNIKTENVVLLMIGNNYQYFRISPKKQPVLFFKYFWNKCFGKKKIIFNFYSREFTVAAYKQANLFLCPSNVECSP
ncbi:MAG: glycosyltransferase family 4 protein, partial [Bacteroidia bacterium]